MFDMLNSISELDRLPEIIESPENAGGKQAPEPPAFLAAIVQSNPDAIVGEDLNGIITSWNPAAERIFGFTAAEMIGQHVTRAVPEDRRGEVEELIERAGAGNPVVGFETERKTKDGRTITVSLTLSPVYNEAGTVIGLAKIARDITEKRAVEKRLREMLEMETIGWLAGKVAHDFNNLLTIVNGNAAKIAGQFPEGDSVRRCALRIHEAGSRAATLTHQLLALSRQQVLQPQMFNLNTALGALQSELSTLLPSAIVLRLKLQSNLPAVYADPAQIDRAILGLARNARDQMPGAGTLTITTESVAREEIDSAPSLKETEQWVRLSISHTGAGLPEVATAQLFKPDFGGRTGATGVNLEMAMVQGIVLQSGGCISTQNEAGHGVTFHMHLPGCGSQWAPDGSLESSPDTNRISATILLVEDDALLREYTSECLREIGYRVIEAADGASGIEIGRQQANQIDLLITDVMMPKKNGRDVALALAALSPGMQVLFLSGYSEDIIPRDGPLEPGFEFLAKPFDPDQLERKVKKMLETSGRPKNILVVDDEPSVRKLIAGILADCGYSVAEAVDGDSAIQRAQRQAPDLIIMDLVMPNREGIETIRHFHKTFPCLPIIAMSGNGQYLEPAKGLGASAVLVKPFDAGHLLSAVRTVIG
jgi:PAS domain S-box-containing protein